MTLNFKPTSAMRLSPVTRSYVFKGRKNSKKESSLIEGMSTKHLRQSGPGNKSWIEEEKATAEGPGVNTSTGKKTYRH
ncbi:hypothetical protein M514_08178 [Trichuris suis]|uniref:Uncharacterized protein n=1 Tax=Trichuris suis TaxID=68888 RepID=A0A085NR29_9BILA|nr:hypothetical protein M514_08178 [Trichuris suis]